MRHPKGQMVALAVDAALPERVSREVVGVHHMPLYGSARYFDGARYFGEAGADVLLGFLQRHMAPPPRGRVAPKPAADVAAVEVDAAEVAVTETDVNVPGLPAAAATATA